MSNKPDFGEGYVPEPVKPAQQEFVSPGGGYVPAIPAQQRPIKTFHGGKAWPVQEPAQQEPWPDEPKGHMAGGVQLSGTSKSKAITELYALFGAPHNADINLTGLNRLLDELIASPPAQPVQDNPLDCGVYLGSGKDHEIKHHVSYGPEPIDTLIAAWQALEETSGHVLDEGDVEGRMHMSVIRSAWEQMDSLVRDLWDERGCK